MSHSKQARRVDVRTGHIFIVWHIDVIPDAVVYARPAVHLAVLSNLSPLISTTGTVFDQSS